jgi:hypothetical protein
MFSEDDLVLYSNGDGIYSGGYSVESILLKSGKAPMQTANISGGGDKNDEQISSLFSDLVVPLGLYCDESSDYFGCPKSYDHTILSDDIYDVLLKNVSATPKQAPLTRKNNSSRAKRTRKNIVIK